MIYRERRERRAERLREWADSRAAKADAARAKTTALADQIPFGQPILVGHHSQRHAERDQERIHDGMRRTVEHARMAERHDERADNIEAALARSIYSDDPDAIPALEQRIANLEAERDRIKAYNASCKRMQPDPSLLDEGQRASLASNVSFGLGNKNGTYPAYALTNLGGNIRRNKERLEGLRRAK